MVMNSVIILINGEEERYAVTPDMRVRDVLTEVCQVHGLDSSRHVLSYNNYFLCNDSQFKILNFLENKTLKLLEDFRPTNNGSVKVVLRIKDSFISSFFHPDVSLWKVVENLVATVTLQIPGTTPVLTCEETEYIGFHELSKVTPRSLGVTNGLLHFRFSIVEDHVLTKRTGGMLGSMQSMQFELVKNYDVTIDLTHRIISSQPIFNDEKIENVVTFFPGTERRGTSVFDEVIYLGERNALAFRLPDRIMIYPNELDDDFYNLAVEDVKTMYRLLHKERKELEKQIIRPKDKYDKSVKKGNQITVIRIQFPDRTVLQGIFDAHEKIKDVEEFVKCYRRIPKEFQLRPPKIILDSEKTLAEYELVPNGKVFYKVIAGGHPHLTAYLREDVLRNLTTHEGACYAAALCRPTFPIDRNSKEEQLQSESETNTLNNLKVSFSSLDSSDKKGFILRAFESRRSQFRFF